MSTLLGVDDSGGNGPGTGDFLLRESCKLKSVEEMVTGIPAGCGILVLALLPHIQHPASGPPAVLSIWCYRFLLVVAAPISPSGLSIAFGDSPS